KRRFLCRRVDYACLIALLAFAFRERLFSHLRLTAASEIEEHGRAGPGPGRPSYVACVDRSMPRFENSPVPFLWPTRRRRILRARPAAIDNTDRPKTRNPVPELGSWSWAERLCSGR